MATTAKSVTMLEIGEEGSAFAIPISLKKIGSKSDVTFDSASPGGNPLKEVKVDLVTGEVVPSGEVQKGTFRSKPRKSDKATWGDFAVVKPEDLDTIAEATALDTFVVEHFIALADVPMERVQDAYFIAPASGMSSKPLVMLARALKRKKAAGVFKMVKTSRQHLAVVYEKDGGLIVNTLAYANDFAAVREAAEALAAQPVKIARGEQEMAETLIGMLTSPADVLDSYEDDLVVLKADLIERAAQGKELPKRKARKQSAAAEDGLEARLRETLAKTKASPPIAKVAA